MVKALTLQDALQCISATDKGMSLTSDLPVKIKSQTHWGLLTPPPTGGALDKAIELFKELRSAVDETERTAWEALLRLNEFSSDFLPATENRSTLSIDYSGETKFLKPFSEHAYYPAQKKANLNRQSLTTGGWGGKGVSRDGVGMWMPVELCPVTQNNIMDIMLKWLQKEEKNVVAAELFFDFFGDSQMTHKGVWFRDLWDIATGTRINLALTLEHQKQGVGEKDTPAQIYKKANTADINTLAYFIAQIQEMHPASDTHKATNAQTLVSYPFANNSLQDQISLVLNTNVVARKFTELEPNPLEYWNTHATTNTDYKIIVDRWRRAATSTAVATEAEKHYIGERSVLNSPVRETRSAASTADWIKALTTCDTFWAYRKLKLWVDEVLRVVKTIDHKVRDPPKPKDLAANQDRIKAIVGQLRSAVETTDNVNNRIRLNIGIVAAAKAQLALLATRGIIAEDRKARATQRLCDNNREDEVRALLRDMYNALVKNKEISHADTRLFNTVCQKEYAAMAAETANKETPFYLGGLWRKLLAKAAGDTSIAQIFPIGANNNREALTAVTGNMVRLSALAARAVEADGEEAELALQRASDRARLDTLMEACLTRATAAVDGTADLNYTGLFKDAVQKSPALKTPLDDLLVQLRDKNLHQRLWYDNGSEIHFITEGAESFGFKMNLILKGSAGTGKTRTANAYAKFLGSIGYLPADCEPSVVSNADVIGQFVGQTAPRVKKAVGNNLDGVLFLDEAYAMTDGALPGESGYGAEFNGTLVERMSRFSLLIIVVAAGYKEKMETHFVKTNDGYARRFQTQIHTDEFVTLNNLVAAVTSHGTVGKKKFYDRAKTVMQAVNATTERYSNTDIEAAGTDAFTPEAARHLVQDMFPSQFASVADVRAWVMSDRAVWTVPPPPANAPTSEVTRLINHMNDPKNGLERVGQYGETLLDWKFGLKHFQASNPASA